MVVERVGANLMGCIFLGANKSGLVDALKGECNVTSVPISVQFHKESRMIMLWLQFHRIKSCVVPFTARYKVRNT